MEENEIKKRYLEEAAESAKNMDPNVVKQKLSEDIDDENVITDDETKNQDDEQKKSVSGKKLLENITNPDEKRILEKEIKDEKKKLSSLPRSQRKKKAYENVLTRRGYPIDKTGKFELKNGKPKELEIIEDKFSLVSRFKLMKYIKKFDPSIANIINKEIKKELSNIRNKYNVKSIPNNMY